MHHGKQNNRVYLIGFDPEDRKSITEDLNMLAQTNGYDKIVAKVPKSVSSVFLGAGYTAEAIVPGYYHGAEDCLLFSRFLSQKRKTALNLNELQSTIKIAREKKYAPPGAMPGGYGLLLMTPEMCGEMAALYKKVFKTYPYPIFDPQYLKNTMLDNIVYFGVLYDGKLAALASGEMNEAYKNAEMTDFAIDPVHRGQSLSKHLLAAAEREMERKGLRTLYTIARAESVPMNCTFSGMGYSFGGTLVNNTQIAGKIESMNVWHKIL